jgi:xanthine dehydrogenase small subunit
VRTPVSRLALLRPRRLTEALRMLRDDAALEPLAGCTDVYVALNAGGLTAQRFLDLWPLDELRGITVRERRLRLGALTTYTAILASRLVRARVPMLAAAAREVGGRQIQHRGTIGGNVANASPAGDTLPVLAAADADVVLVSADRGERRVPLTRFYSGYRSTVRRPDELVAAIEIPPILGRQWWRKVGTRRAQAISKVVVAGTYLDAGPHHAPLVRLAFGSVAPTVVRVPATEAALSEGASVAEAQGVLAAEVAPIDDLRSTADYRRAVCVNLLARFLREAGGRERKVVSSNQ